MNDEFEKWQKLIIFFTLITALCFNIALCIAIYRFLLLVGG